MRTYLIVLSSEEEAKLTYSVEQRNAGKEPEDQVKPAELLKGWISKRLDLETIWPQVIGMSADPGT